MDWQTFSTIAISAGCGLWALWCFIRPLVHPGPHCDDCGGHPAPPELLQIDPAQPKKL